MALLHAGVDTTVIALWLGHADPRSTNAYLHADLAIKERALAQLTRPRQNRADIGLGTNSWRSSKHCEYADNMHHTTANAARPQVDHQSGMPVSA